MERPSKTQRKRAMAALQEIGAQLVELNAEQLAQIELPEALYDAVKEAQRIRDFEGRRRQLQYIGKLMRTVDAVPIRAKLEQWDGQTREHAMLQQLAERWRALLLNDDIAFTRFVADYPGCDVRLLQSLIADVKHERAASRPPRNYRELLRAIRDIIGHR